MKKFKGTSGEWELSDEDANGLYVQTDDRINKAAICKIYGTRREKSEALANAKIIAASPDLLEALQGFMALRELIQPENTISSITEEHEGEQIALLKMFRKADKAISKALD